MKKLALIAAVLIGAAATSQAGVDIHIGIPFPPLPRVIFGIPAPVVVAPRYPCPPPVVVPPLPCGWPVYGYGYGYYPHHHGYYRGNYHDGGYGYPQGNHGPHGHR